jgi:DNA helicase-2/ATP-dependent DNA helicase PcrA
MHKTKGSGIDNVLVVLDEFFWNEYNFSCIFDDSEQNLEKKLKNQKLFYVACTRAVNNLICVKLIQECERDDLINAFPDSEEIFL